MRFRARSSRLEVDPKALPFRFRVAELPDAACLEDISCRTRSFINITSIPLVHCRVSHPFPPPPPPPFSHSVISRILFLSFKRKRFHLARGEEGGGAGIFHRSSGIHFRYAWKLGFNEFIPRTKLSSFNLPFAGSDQPRGYCTRAKTREHARFPLPPPPA